MTIKQSFYLTSEAQEIIKKSAKSKKSQLKVEEAISLIRRQCGLDALDTEINLIKKIASQILSSYNKAIIISIGGSMSASRSFTACRNYQSDHFKLIYSDSLSFQKQQEIFTEDNLQNAAIIIISRSGNSVETLHQTRIVIDKYYKYFGENYSLGKHFFIITKGDNPLKEIGCKIGGNILEYVSYGGKFSSFSMAGLLPARLIGMAPDKIIAGAKAILDNPNNSIQAVLVNHYLLSQGYNINIMTHYDDLFDQVLARYMQISGEIIAKEGKGFSAIVTRGVFDQHGLWQLFLSGPKDKYFTFLVNREDYNNKNISSFIEQAYHELNINRIKEKDIPARELIITKMDDYNLGALTMQLLLEMIMLANLLNISSVTQPDIDKGKEILGRMYFSYIQT